jgi:hypothetical protein
LDGFAAKTGAKVGMSLALNNAQSILFAGEAARKSRRRVPIRVVRGANDGFNSENRSAFARGFGTPANYARPLRGSGPEFAIDSFTP